MGEQTVGVRLVTGIEIYDDEVQVQEWGMGEQGVNDEGGDNVEGKRRWFRFE